MNELKSLNREQLLKLLSILALSDGHIYKRKGIPANIRLVTSPFGKSQHQLFQYLCLTLFGKKTHTKKIYVKPNNKIFLLSELNFRNGIKELYEFSPEYNTTPGKKTKEEYLKINQPTISFLSNEDTKMKWLAFRTYFDFDGSISPSIKLKNKIEGKYQYFQVQFECEIKISETNPNLVRELVDLSNQLGLKAIIKKDKRNWSMLSGICISERKSVKKFLEEGGPLTDVEISGKSNRFKGVKKKALCKTLNNLFDDKEFTFSKSFKNKKEAEKYRKNMIQLIFPKNIYK
jgi:hypothetical protein